MAVLDILSHTTTDVPPRELAIINPYDLSPIETLPLHIWADADAALNAARGAFARRSGWLPPHERSAILLRVADAIERDAEEFAMLIAREGGKPIVDARIEVARAMLGTRLCATEMAAGLTGTHVPSVHSPAASGRTMHTVREPIGVVLAISAFNHPLNLLVHQIMPAIAVGCPVIIKPALATPLTCRKLIDIIHRCGLGEAWCQMVLCDNETTQHMASDARLAFVSFIGSAKVGWALRSRLAPGVRCALEHGGNAPAIVLPYAHQEEAIATLLKGGMMHAGQVCVSVQRVFVPWAEGGHFARKMGEAAETLKVGNPLNDSTQVGPLISPSQVTRVNEWVKEAISMGAKLMSGGEPISETMYQPTVLFDPPPQAKVSREEIFGPVICVYGYDEVEDAIARANDSPYGFQAAVWGRQYDELQRVAMALNASTVMFNDHTAFRVDWMPFGGRGQSGLGAGGLVHTMRDYTQEKLLVHRSGN